MGKHSGKPAGEPTTDAGKPFNQMSGEEKGKEFDASHNDPKGYASRNFTQENAGRPKGKHGK
jgi:hypothetical protein